MPTRKAARTEPTGTTPATQTLLSPRPEAPPATSGAAEQPLPVETARQPVESARPAGNSTGGRPESSGSEVLLDAVVASVISTLDVGGVSQELTTKLAEQILSHIRVDALVTTLLEGQSEALTARLTERLIARLLGLE